MPHVHIWKFKKKSIINIDQRDRSISIFEIWIEIAPSHHHMQQYAKDRVQIGSVVLSINSWTRQRDIGTNVRTNVRTHKPKFYRPSQIASRVFQTRFARITLLTQSVLCFVLVTNPWVVFVIGNDRVTRPLPNLANPPRLKVGRVPGFTLDILKSGMFKVKSGKKKFEKIFSKKIFLRFFRF